MSERFRETIGGLFLGDVKDSSKIAEESSEAQATKKGKERLATGRKRRRKVFAPVGRLGVGLGAYYHFRRISR